VSALFHSARQLLMILRRGAWRAPDQFRYDEAKIRRALVRYWFYEYLAFALVLAEFTRYHHHLTPTENAPRKNLHADQSPRIEG